MVGALVFIAIGYLAAASAVGIIGELTENELMANIGVWALIALLAVFAVVLLSCGVAALF